MFTDILLAISPVEPCRPALEAASSLASRYGARLLELSVRGFEDETRQTLAKCLSPRDIQAARDGLERFCAPMATRVWDRALAVEEGFPHVEILRAAHRIDADLIVLGAHLGQCRETGGPLWGLAGSCLEKVSRQARCPVMMVPGPCPEPLDGSCIVAATDLSPAADCAVAYAAQLAASTKSMLAILHVLPGREASPARPESERETMRARMAERYASWCKPVRSHFFETTQGPVSQAILDFAGEWRAGTVVKAHQVADSDLEQAFQESATVRVALHARCPVVSVNRSFSLRCPQAA